MVQVARKSNAAPAIPVHLLAEVQDFAAKHQPELAVATQGSYVVLRGKLTIMSPLGPFDIYDVDIGVPADFPFSAPTVYETGGRVPRIADRHVFEDGENCCLGVWEEWLITSTDHSVSSFMNELLNDYFISQSWYENHNEWPFGQRSHGALGILEAYCGLLEIDLDARLARAYLSLLSHQQIKGHQICPCGSGHRLRACHLEKVRELQGRIVPTMAERMLRRLPSM